MEKQTAQKVQQKALNSVENLAEILELINPKEVGADEYERIKRAVGELIGETDIKLLSIVYQQFPELDHLK